MRNLKRVLIFLLSLLIAAASFTACGGSSKEKETIRTQGQNTDTSWQTVTEGSGGIALPISKEPLEYEFMVYEVATYPYKDSFLIPKELQKRTNIKLNINATPMESYNQKLEIQLTAGEYADIIGGMTYQLINRNGAQGKFLNVLDYLDDMPNFKKVLEAYPFLNQNKYDSNVMYSLPLLINDENAERNYFRNLWMLRSDIAKKHNLKIPETTDELYSFLKELKRIYPESFPWSDRHGILTFLSLVAEGWGMIVTGELMLFDPETDTYSYALEDSRFRELLEYCLKLYQEGLLDQELILLPNTPQWEDRMVSGKSFLTIDWFNRTEGFTKAGRENGNPDYTMSAILPPKSPYGERKVRTNDLWQNAIVISSDIENPHEVMKLLDYWLYSKDGSILSYIGVEGVTFEWKDAEKTQWDYIGDDEFPKFTEQDVKRKYGMTIDLMSGVKPQFYGIKNAVPYDDIIQEALDLYRGLGIIPEPRMIFNEEEDAELENYTAFEDYQKQFFANLCIGKKSLSDLNEMIAEVKKLGMEGKLKVYNKNWARRK